ncbi:DUF2141 domain-containing protein [Maricaulis sp.]|uniref:DUF2141 domain-containing protein n=1 Tax=Maricaulis sp. TaxID=1486257 RepID=UPI002B26ECBD|nr:DUF2141 domain-containing protein [Maricaulis sp.]
MTSTLVAAVLASMTSSLAVADDGVATLTLEIGSVAPTDGFVMIGVYDSEAAWNDGPAVAGIRAVVDGDQITVVIPDLPAGTYGVKMYHDVDADGEMDTNLMGIPSEPFAFSNNARGRFGPPAWIDAAFELAADGSVHSVSFD